MKRIRPILHPTDFSAASRPALKWALELARSNGGTLTLVHVMSPILPMVGDGYISPQAWDDLERQVRAHAQKEIGKLIAKARTAGVRGACCWKAPRPIASCAPPGPGGPISS
ncbi:MAG: universal stress protein [Anaerolineales bacterium]